MNLAGIRVWVSPGTAPEDLERVLAKFQRFWLANDGFAHLTEPVEQRVKQVALSIEHGAPPELETVVRWEPR
ncbi:MAG: hypothetical protein IT299_02405 [Dehalococcoidia bacterium]|nr:hypothetical protein [Dehalococcoidia bacterium]